MPCTAVVASETSLCKGAALQLLTIKNAGHVKGFEYCYQQCRKKRIIDLALHSSAVLLMVTIIMLVATGT